MNRTDRRGFVFSIDALLSVLVLAAFMASIVFLSSQLGAGNMQLLDMERKGSDMLVLLDKLGTLAGQNSTAIELAINQTMTSSLSWNLVAEYYNYSVSGSTVAFTLNQTITLGGNDTNAGAVAVADRIFVVKNATTGKIDRYGRARLKVWVE